MQQTIFETAYLGENVISLLKQKVAQNDAIVLGCFIISKNNNEPSNIAQLAKNCPIWSPWFHWEHTELFLMPLLINL
jgi:hypothetical protein